MHFFRTNLFLGKLAPGFWRQTRSLGTSSVPIVKNTVGFHPGQIGSMLRQMQRLGKRGGVADMLKETRGKISAFKSDAKTFGSTAKGLVTGRPYSTNSYQWVYPGGDPTRYILAKALAFTVGTIVVSYFVFPLLFKYTPIGILAKRPDWLIYSLVGINAAFFLLWKSGNPAMMRFMFQNMLLKTGPMFKNAQLLGSAFSHQEFWHFFVNMFVLYQFGIPVAMTMGSAWFCHMYVTSCVVSSFTSLLVPSLLGRAIMSLGASGAIFSVVGVFSSVFPDAAIGLFFIPLPFGAWWFFIGSIGMNIAGLVGRWGRYDYSGHLGGSLSGLYFGWRVNQYRSEMRERMQRQGYPGFRF